MHRGKDKETKCKFLSQLLLLIRYILSLSQAFFLTIQNLKMFGHNQGLNPEPFA